MVTQPQNDGPAYGGSISYSKAVELSWPVHPGIPQWPGDPGVEFETVADIDKDGYFLRRFSMGEHSGTHLSAPASFDSGAPGQQGYSPQDLVRPAIVIDIVLQADNDHDYALSMNDVLDWESDHGPVPKACVVLLRTGWQAKWNNPASYLGGNSADQLHFPGFSLDAARLLIEGRNVAGFGTDTAPRQNPAYRLTYFFVCNRLLKPSVQARTRQPARIDGIIGPKVPKKQHNLMFYFN